MSISKAWQDFTAAVDPTTLMAVYNAGGQAGIEIHLYDTDGVLDKLQKDVRAEMILLTKDARVHYLENWQYELTRAGVEYSDLVDFVKDVFNWQNPAEEFSELAGILRGEAFEWISIELRSELNREKQTEPGVPVDWVALAYVYRLEAGEAEAEISRENADSIAIKYGFAGGTLYNRFRHFLHDGNRTGNRGNEHNKNRKHLNKLKSIIPLLDGYDKAMAIANSEINLFSCQIE